MKHRLFQAALLCMGVVMAILSCTEDSEPTPASPGLADFFGTALDEALKTEDVGYAYTIFQNGELKVKGGGGFQSRTNEAEGAKPFTADTKLHIASMSKTISAIAFLRLASQKGIKSSDKIVNYLPSTWSKGNGVNQITFADLMTHRSGITGLGNTCANGAYSENVYQGLKTIVGKPITNRGNYCYQNANMGLFRVLIPGILGYQFTGNDATDDAGTRAAYLKYLQDDIFGKVGIGNVIPSAPVGNPTYTYDVPYSGQKGWNQGDFSDQMGGYGLYMTATEAGKLYSTVLASTDQSVLTVAYRDTLFQKNFNVYNASGAQGNAKYHDGWWYLLNGANSKGIRTVWVKFEDNMVCVLFVNGLRYQSSSSNAIFPYNSGNIPGFVYSAYGRAKAKAMRKSAESDESVVLENPEPH